MLGQSFLWSIYYNPNTKISFMVCHQQHKLHQCICAPGWYCLKVHCCAFADIHSHLPLWVWRGLEYFSLLWFLLFWIVLCHMQTWPICCLPLGQVHFLKYQLQDRSLGDTHNFLFFSTLWVWVQLTNYRFLSEEQQFFHFLWLMVFMHYHCHWK